ncbi:hypothetical protein GMES_1884 [Paraglaciecola mesophila KMM 241]|uniref:Lipoprotein n=2 Tax=Paraglaciecola mesophila TaxID=197222 RepID=K6ZLD7_9ALTE|nr:hypothetical protein GMES_1884 [Paraglaciecola mesophila KMM 241]
MIRDEDMRLWTALLILLLAGCSSTSQNSGSSLPQTAKIDDKSVTTDTMAYRNLAAVIYPRSFETGGVFRVKATGSLEGRVFLNTEYDYRDPRNISIVLSPEIATEFEKKYEMSPEAYFLKKRVLVKGQLVQVKIWFSSNGKRSNKYYYQTHMRVSSLDDISLMNATVSNVG